MEIMKNNYLRIKKYTLPVVLLVLTYTLTVRGDDQFKLNKEERLKVREAMKLVWTNEEVKVARKAMLEATKGYREALFQALEKVDPELRPVIDRHIRKKIEGRRKKLVGHQTRNNERLNGLKDRLSNELNEEEKNRLNQLHQEILTAGGLGIFPKMEVEPREFGIRSKRKRLKELYLDKIKEKDISLYEAMLNAMPYKREELD